ncbi:YdaF [marine gamma proteobacterium HTCC2207]|uniref:YdaF n=1 Tax=gamma proteobacterium HTCC2207 TaxID=314287 RepID=Q1YP70_9GAMM|nr:YdaF [marine gamma proteobacterium HTCC2207] [gamma proteobacterium HTCC2207]MBT5105522.1 GNAT family N-acetyltransferase [Porticoccaceae bacterium]MBT6115759.1 GNAT family N-acetyltransferase [Porticoccaceae bacterium]
METESQLNSEIELEKLNVNHSQELYDLTEANRNYLSEWLPWLDQIKTSRDTKTFIESTVKVASSGGAPNYAVLYKGAICGVVGFHEINKQHRIGSIGYWLGEVFTGKGVMTAAVAKLLTVGFVQFDLNKIEIRCAEGNLRSRAIPERLGFTYEATLRQCEWLYSEYVNHAIYSMLKSEHLT